MMRFACSEPVQVSGRRLSTPLEDHPLEDHLEDQGGCARPALARRPELIYRSLRAVPIYVPGTVPRTTTARARPRSTGKD
jgi:hypothetical protein